MKSIGIVRKIDQLGRIAIPKEIRNTLQLDEKEPLEIFISDEHIILQKYNPGCCICGEIENTKPVKKKRLCQNCIDALGD